VMGRPAHIFFLLFFFLSKFRFNENVHFRLILFFHANWADDDWWLLLCIWRKEKRHSGAPRTCNLINYTTHGVVSYIIAYSP
jgi:hypothetical protein